MPCYGLVERGHGQQRTIKRRQKARTADGERTLARRQSARNRPPRRHRPRQRPGASLVRRRERSGAGATHASASMQSLVRPRPATGDRRRPGESDLSMRSSFGYSASMYCSTPGTAASRRDRRLGHRRLAIAREEAVGHLHSPDHAPDRCEPSESRLGLSLRLMNRLVVRSVRVYCAKLIVPRSLGTRTESGRTLRWLQIRAIAGSPAMPNCAMKPATTR